MRCFFMQNGRICGVEYLQQTDDQERIAEAHELFKSHRLAVGADGFEVWDGQRFVYRFIIQGTLQPESSPAAYKSPPDWFRRLMRGFKSGSSDFGVIAGYPVMVACSSYRAA